jgi:HPt (histidine-containing phosphotransfer) domain-containing protein
MSNKKTDALIQQMENYLECWKQFNYFVNLARSKKFSQEEETQFLEVKSVLIQELELIFAGVEVTSPSKEEVHTLIGNAPSLRNLSELNEPAQRNIENQWHKIYIGWHAILGQLKVRQQAEGDKSAFSGFFGSGKKKEK